MKRKLTVLALALVPMVSGACSWLTDFRIQPSVGTWQSLDVTWRDTTTPFRGNPQNSVSTAGTIVAAYQISYGKTEATIDSFSALRNPEAPTQASVDRGWKYFQTNCAACHGNEGAMSKLAQGFAIFAPSLVTDAVKNRSDGYIFGMIRNGKNNMPTMNRIDEGDRWHVINYLRGLQGKLASDIVIRKEPPGLPGETGDKLPGATMTAPTRGAPFAKPAYVVTPGSSAEAAKREEHK